MDTDNKFSPLSNNMEQKPSQSQEGKSRFDFSQQSQSKSVRGDAKQVSFGGEKLLVIDDEEMSLRYLCALLRNAGYGISATQSPEEALKILDDEEISLIVTDLKMPTMSGLELAKNVRSDSRFENLPIIICTAFVDREIIQAAAKLNVNGYVIKPINKNVLLEKINAIFQVK